MRYVALTVLVLALAACGGTSGHPAATVTKTVTARPSASSSAVSPTPAKTDATALANANARLITYGIASDTEASISALSSSIAGPVMSAYVRLQALYAEAYADAGQPAVSGSVTSIRDGYQVCNPANAGGGCQSFTGFRSDSQGRITDFAVDGQLISGRIATGPDSTGSGLALSSVRSYLFTSIGMVAVICEVRNTGSQTVGTVNPAFLPVFVTSDGRQLSYNSTYSVLPGPLQPGESIALIAAFDTRTITGQFSLRTNDQTEGILVSSKLSRPPVTS